jgi:hypothetical protein
MYIAKREGFAGTWDYFQDNINDSPKWTRDKEKAKRFVTESEALSSSNVSGLYTILLEVVEE